MTKTIPRATYRLQLRPEFDFNDAAGVCDYLAALGVSHLYSSPYLQAAPGSAHGYDVVDPGRVNDELGGRPGHEHLRAAMSDNSLGHVLDIVPNHMSIAATGNTWWWDVLENGPSSHYALHFDVDWDHPSPRFGNRILLPILGDHYGRVLESGELAIERDGADFGIRYHDKTFPAAPRSLGALLSRAASQACSDELAFIADAVVDLPLPTATDRKSTLRRHRDKAVLGARLKTLLETEPQVSSALDDVLAETNRDWDALDAVLDAQNYRLAYWRTAGQELGYRRFFDITSLVGLRVEDEAVFMDTHQLVLGWLAEGVLDGVRIDHPDGLRNPEAYLQRLREAAPDAWIVVEKILEPGEELPPSWPVAGTTGYDFMHAVGGLFVDPASEGAFTAIYERFTASEAPDYEAMVRRKKLDVLQTGLAADLQRLVSLLVEICEQHRLWRDYTGHELGQALAETIACLPVYRTYVRAEDDPPIVREMDRKHWEHALGKAKDHRPDLAEDLFTFLEEVFTLKLRGPLENELVMRLQQLTGAVMAKGVEDTTFYCYHRFVALNEVGGDPGTFGSTVDEFHARMQKAPVHAMLGTSTHDTKRAEDVRARLSVLSEIPEEWERAAASFAERAAPYRGDLVDRNTEYLFWQTLVGAWPLTKDRARDYMTKAMKESKVHTSWTQPDEAYEKAIVAFVGHVMDDQELMADVERFVTRLLHPGRINSLAQKLLTLTCPGVPDIYQGTELWDLSLVDPDNRRPVDYDLRRRLLGELDSLSPETILARMDDALPKLWVTKQALSLRARDPSWASAPYRPLEASGKHADHVVAFTRGDRAAVIVPRLASHVTTWADTQVALPEGSWHNELTGDDLPRATLTISSLFTRFPVALLTKRS